MKKTYQSKIDYSKKYNSIRSSIQISKVLHSELKEFLGGKITIQNWIEDLIREQIIKQTENK
jgi:hypothetical protein